MLIQSKGFPSKPREACPKACRKPAREGVQAGEKGSGGGVAVIKGLADGSELGCRRFATRLRTARKRLAAQTSANRIILEGEKREKGE